MVRKLTTDEISNFEKELTDLVEVNTFSSLVKKAWEGAMKQPVEKTMVELPSGETMTLDELLSHYDKGDYTAEMKETLGQVVNVPKISQKLNRLTHGQFSAAIGKKLNSSLGALKAEHEKILKDKRQIPQAKEEEKLTAVPLANSTEGEKKVSIAPPVPTMIVKENKNENERKGIDLARIRRYRRTGGISIPESGQRLH